MNSNENGGKKREENETLFFKEIINMEYGVNEEERKADLILTFLLTTKSEEKRYKSIIRYEDVADFKFKNNGNLVFLMNNLCMIENKENESDGSKKYHVFDPDTKGGAFEHIEFFCRKIEVVELKKID